MDDNRQEKPKFKKSLIEQITRKIVLLSTITLLGIVSNILLSSVFMTKKIEGTMEQISEHKIDTFKLFFTELTNNILRNQVLFTTANQQEIKQKLRQIRWHNPAILDILLVNNKGIIVAQSSRSFRSKFTKLEQQPWLSQLKEATQVWLGSVKYDRNTYSVTMAVKVTNELGLPDQDLNLVAHIDLTELWRKLVETKIGTTNIYITDKSNGVNRIIVHRDIRLLNAEISPETGIIKNLGNLTIETSPDQQWVIAYHKAFDISFSEESIRSLNNVVWIVTVEQPFSEAILSFIPLLITLTIVFIIGIIIVIDILKFIKQRVIQPIDILYQAVIILKNDEPFKEIEIENNDELGELAKAFNQLIKQLQESLETLENRVKERTLELTKANQAKREFLSNINHEIRNPLNLIIGYAERLYQDSSLNIEQKQQLNIINRSSEHLLSLINKLLDISKIEAGQVSLEKNSFDLFQLLEQIKEMFALTAGSKGLKIIVDNQLNDQIRYIYADESKLRQVLINLVSNAIKFTEEGTITLRAKFLDIQTSEKKNNQEKLKFIQLELEDTGQGISSEEINKLFRSFEQTETGRKSKIGTGLGLYLSRQFIELMDGKITVKSSLNVGTIFTIKLSVKLSKQEDILPKKYAKKVIGLVPNQPDYRILVVDDHLESRDLLVNLLSSIGLSVKAAANGQEAINLWQQWQPHLIWMDLEMPVMDGYEATRQIKNMANGLSPHIIVLTADASEKKREIALNYGCDDFIGKPFQSSIIWEKMSQYLGIQYIYEQSVTMTNFPLKQEDFPSILTPDSFKQMSREWLEELYQGSIHLNGKQVIFLIEQISGSHPLLAKSLKELAETYQFEKIANLIDPHL